MTRKEILKKMEENPILLYNKPMKVKYQEKYLGEQICPGMAESVNATINKRKGLALLAISDIANIVNDARVNIVGGMKTALLIWEQAVLPFLLNSSDTWIGIDRTAMKSLTDIQNTFLRRVLKVGNSCPIPLMYFDLGQLLMENRILKAKLLFLFHVSHLEEKSLARKFYEKQKKEKSVPGLVKELRKTLTKMGVTFGELECVSKKAWKKSVIDFVTRKNEKEVLDRMKNYHKLNYEVLSKERCELKEYMNNLSYNDACMKFRLRASLVPTVKSHYKSDPQFARDLWSCPEGCKRIDTVSHIQRCSKYFDLRENLSLENDHDLVKYFQSVIERRRQREEEDQQ